METVTFNYVCDAGQPNNNVGGWYDKAYCSYVCLETGEATKIDNLGEIGINHAETRAIIHILWSLKKRYSVNTSCITVNIKSDSRTAISTFTKKKANKKAKLLKEREVFLKLASSFASVNFIWVPRTEIVKVLGH